MSNCQFHSYNSGEFDLQGPGVTDKTSAETFSDIDEVLAAGSTTPVLVEPAVSPPELSRRLASPPVDG